MKNVTALDNSNTCKYSRNQKNVKTDTNVGSCIEITSQEDSKKLVASLVEGKEMEVENNLDLDDKLSCTSINATSMEQMKEEMGKFFQIQPN